MFVINKDSIIHKIITNIYNKRIIEIEEYHQFEYLFQFLDNKNIKNN